MHQSIPNSFQEDVNFVSPQKAFAMGKANMDYKPVDSKGTKAAGKAPAKMTKGGGH